MTRAALVAAWLAILLVAAELGARALLRSQPLVVSAPEIEYMYRPDQDVTRSGKRIVINRWGMRSAPVAAQPGPGETRLLALGDSVLNGETITDHSELATTLLDGRRLADGRVLRVMNISAGSWGPGNLLAYVERFGIFGAAHAVLVLSSHDIGDDRTVAALDPARRPAEPAALALTEAARKLWRRLRSGAPALAGDARRSLPALLDRLRATGATVCVVLHPESGEIGDPELARGLREIRDIAAQSGADVVDARRFLSAPGDYRDFIHLTTSGQRALAAAIAGCPHLPAMAGQPAGRRPTGPPQE